MSGRYSGLRNRLKCERMTEMIVKYGSPNSHINTIRQLMKGSLLSTILELLNSRSNESSEEQKRYTANIDAN